MRLSVWAVGIAAIVASGSAFAADLDLPTHKAPPPPPSAFTWTGFYVGGYAGYGWARSTATDIGDPFGTPWYILGHEFSTAPTSFTGGGEVGYNYQWGQFVVGAEADVGYFNHHGSALYDNTPGHSDTSIIASGDMNSTLRGRLGFAVDRALVFATGGVAATNATARVVSFSSFISPNADLQWGWTIGGGLEYAVTNNWSIKGEYLHDDFGQSDVTLANTTSRFRIHSTDDAIRFGVNFRFN